MGYSVSSYSPIHFYCATKYAITAIAEGVRQELREMKSNCRVSVSAFLIVRVRHEFSNTICPLTFLLVMLLYTDLYLGYNGVARLILIFSVTMATFSRLRGSEVFCCLIPHFPNYFCTSSNLEIKIQGHDPDQSDLVYAVGGYFLAFWNKLVVQCKGYCIKQCCYFL